MGEKVKTSLAKHWYDEGREEGREKGRKEGREEGREKGKEETAINMLKLGSDIKFVAKVTGLSQKRIEEFKKSLK